MNILYRVFILCIVLLSLPLQVMVGFLVYVFSGKPIFFLQQRVGKDNTPFFIYKFRTMQPNAERDRRHLLLQNEARGPVFKIHDDPRFTTIGKFLAHTGLDELPQLWNVLKGDMALIGPRPLPVYEFKKLTSWQQKRQVILPGIISPWILNGYHRQSFEKWMKSDLLYIEQKSIVYDCILSAKCVGLLTMLFLREVKHIVCPQETHAS